MRYLQKYFLPWAVTAVLAACASEPATEQYAETSTSNAAAPSTSQPTTAEAVTLEVQLQERSTRGSRGAARYLGGYDDIDNITIDVKNATTGSTLQSTYLSNVGGVWTGQVFDINVGQVYQFDGRAYDNQSVLIFAGTTQQSLDNGTNSLNLRMDPIADEAVLAIPRITRIMVPSSVGTGDNATVQVEIEGSSGAQLDYIFEAPQGGSFSPSVGSVNLLGTSATLSSTYFAPVSAGQRTNTVSVKNQQGVGVKSSFSIGVTVVGGASISGIQFSPVVTSLVGWRDNDTDSILWTADVSDDGPLDQIRYEWDFTANNDNGSLGVPTPTFANATVNPATMLNYDPSFSGTVTLTVTDDNGTGASTEITYQMKAGQFPSGLVVDKDIVGAFNLVTTLKDDNGTTVGYIDGIAGGDRYDNATGAWITTDEDDSLYFTTGSDVWTLDNGTARQLPAYFDNGSAMRLQIYDWQFQRGGLTDDGRYFFFARVYDNATGQSLGGEPLVADNAGVRLLGDLRPGSNGSEPYSFTQSGNQMFFHSYRGDSYWPLYKVDLDGADNATLVENTATRYPYDLMDITLDSEPDHVTRLLYNSNYDPNGNCCYGQLYVTNGDNATSALSGMPPRSGSYYRSLQRLSDTLYFAYNNDLYQLPLDSVRLLQPGESDDNGTVVDNMTWTASAVKITNIGTSSFSNLMQADGKLYFTANSRLWESDTTPSGTRAVTDSSDLSVRGVTDLNGELLYYGYESYPTYDYALYTTAQSTNDNGTTGHTRLGTFDSMNGFLAQTPNGKQFFTARDSENQYGYELWVTDGTPSGTMMLADIYSGYGSGVSSPQARVVGNLLYFTANDGVSGEELWVSNGTPAGTLQVRDLRPGASSSGIKFFSLDGQLYFFANDGGGVKVYKKED